jgi:tRNA modification GTPase
VRGLEDTICALSSAPGRAGIAVVRISGAGSFSIIHRVFIPDQGGDELPPRHAVLGRVVESGSGKELDRGLVTCFPAPHSYTGEDVAEISLHGSPVIVRAVLQEICGSGARIADPGEFTMRAFLRGRMDLVQAEAVRDIIEASTLYQAQVASRQQSGQLSRVLDPAKKLLIDTIVQLESAVEFADEDLLLESRELLARKLSEVKRRLEEWIASFNKGRVVRDGFALAIAGRPNVGKSSIFNALLSENRSIVTELAGTTRDLISEYTQMNGIPVRLLDTAGLRAPTDRIERLGVERSYGAMAEADAILLVVDASQPVSAEDWDLCRRLEGLSYIVVYNKSDLPASWSAEEKGAYAADRIYVDVSARTGESLEVLRSAIMSRLFGDTGSESDGILITSLRHCRCLEAALEHLTKGVAALDSGLSEEYVLVDLHASLSKLGEITGETGMEELLGEIFSRFCVGK